MTPAMRITANDIEALLEARHANDVWVRECNLGSALAGCGRIDGWAMRKSWSPLATYGYEIKVSRSDFLRDDKWLGYSDYVHHLYLVCPTGLVQPSEIPEGCGLIWVSKNAKRLLTKIKAPRRAPERLSRVLAYILMSRADIVNASKCSETRAERISRWAEWVSERRAAGEVGRTVSGTVGQAIREQEARLQRLQAENENLDRVRRRIIELGFDPGSPVGSWQVTTRLDRLYSAIPSQDITSIRDTVSALLRGLDRLESKE